jgi:hypothetical protein
MASSSALAWTWRTQRRLGNSETDQFTVGELGSVAAAGTGCHDMVVNQYVKCGQEGVQVVRHRLILNTLSPCPDIDPVHMIFTASII